MKDQHQSTTVATKVEVLLAKNVDRSADDLPEMITGNLQYDKLLHQILSEIAKM